MQIWFKLEKMFGRKTVQNPLIQSKSQPPVAGLKLKTGWGNPIIDLSVLAQSLIDCDLEAMGQQTKALANQSHRE